MTENMAGRGEGVKGLASKWRARVKPIANLGESNQILAGWVNACADELETALEAAAPAGTAPPSKLLDLGRELRERQRNQDGIYHPIAAEAFGVCADAIESALATPSPQTPKWGAEIAARAEFGDLSPTSAREQSSATASDKRSVGILPKIGWMDSVDFDHELGHCKTSGIHADERACRQEHTCIVPPADPEYYCYPKRVYVFDADTYDALPAATQEPAGSEAIKGGSMVETKEQYEARMLMPDLCLRGKATDHIWLMEDVEGYIGIRMDCGDSGTVYMTNEQARDLALQVMSLQPGSPRKVGEDGAQTFEQWWQAEGARIVRTTHCTRYEAMKEAWNAALARPSSAPAPEHVDRQIRHLAEWICEVDGYSEQSLIDRITGCFNELLANVALGSPRKVGEDGAGELLRVLKAALKQTSCDGDLCMYDWHEDARRVISEVEESRPSSAPVGEQKQEDGV